MPKWSDQPPTTPDGIPYRLMRVPPAATLKGIVTCTDIIGCSTHYVSHRTIPCDGPEDCKACAEGYPRRWHAYVSMVLSGSYEHVILELTAAASDPLRNYANVQGNTRGCLITANRPSGRPNGRITLSCRPTDEVRIRIPDPPNLHRILCHIWGVRYDPQDLDCSSRPPARQVRIQPRDDDARYTA